MRSGKSGGWFILNLRAQALNSEIMLSIRGRLKGEAMDADASPDPVTRCKMRHVQHPCVLRPSGIRAFWLAIGKAVLVVLLICGDPVGFASSLSAQPSGPQATSAQGFTPASPFRYRNRLPPYPDDALNSGQEGIVRLRLSIARDGKVNRVVVLRSSGSTTLDRRAADWILRRWRFHPATRNGTPIDSQYALSVTFAIRK